ncbi:MAG: hypothetical protein IAI49_02975 [Candidatus Eremiobacteraeota bacterium]|nr:hypothetical protein [Candidatus Eremiobacteraeota bacterium]
MIARGLLAGAAGILALDAYTYVDIFVRGRPPSDLPATTVQKLAQTFGIGGLASEESEVAKNRRGGAGALLGYGVGLGSAISYSTVRPFLEEWIPWPMAGAILGATTLVVSEGSATALGATDWSTWSVSDWISDIVPRTLYGLSVAYVCEILDDAD